MEMGADKRMNIRDDIHFFDMSRYTVTADIEKRANETYIRRELEKRFPTDVFTQITVTHNSTGEYRAKASWFEKLWGAGKPVTGLPEYYEVEILHKTGQHTEDLIVWSPVVWNDRFAGTAGGGTGIGGRNYLTKPDNCSRGWTVPYAVCNGFTAATMYAGNIDGWKDHTIDAKTGELDRELYENWRIRSTHNMTVFGKAVAEILHDRPVRYAYMNGGSGGGRQCLMEVQNYPQDYNGVWASCPAINWHYFLMGGFWPEVVMREKQHFLSPKKNSFFLEQVYKKYGGKKNFYRMTQKPEFDADSCVGMKSPGGVITQTDADVMNEIWRGPHRRNGEPLWYGYYPGCKNWQVLIPIGTYYYPTPFSKKIKPFILGPLYARWITENPKQTFETMTWDAYVELFDQGTAKFGDNLADNACIDEFVQAGGKLMIDHGMDDPLIPTEGTIDYYNKLVRHFGGKSIVDTFCRLYINPGDNHGNCWGNGPGITQSAGIKALVDWVEQGGVPDKIHTVRINSKNGALLEKGVASPF